LEPVRPPLASFILIELHNINNEWIVKVRVDKQAVFIRNKHNVDISWH
jgi:hypothetical protein